MDKKRRPKKRKTKPTKADREVADKIAAIFLTQRKIAEEESRSISVKIMSNLFPNGLPAVPGMDELQDLIRVAAHVTYSELEWAGTEGDVIGSEVSYAFGKLVRAVEV